MATMSCVILRKSLNLVIPSVPSIVRQRLEKAKIGKAVEVGSTLFRANFLSRQEDDMCRLYLYALRKNAWLEGYISPSKILGEVK